MLLVDARAINYRSFLDLARIIKMKKLLVILIALAFVSPAYAAKKPVKKHQKFEGTKIADDKPTKPKAPVKKKK